MTDPDNYEMPQHFEGSANDVYDEIRNSTPGRSHNYKIPTQGSYPDQAHTIYNEKRNAKNYKQLWIGIIGGSLLSIMIAVPTVYFLKSCKCVKNNTSTYVSDDNFPLKFDQSTLYHSAFMSKDGLKLSNTYSKDTPVSSVKNPKTLSNYQGVIGNRCIDGNSKIFFEVQYEFRVIGTPSTNALIFEIGLAERERVDNYHYVGTTRTRGWSFFLHVCDSTENKTCLIAQHNNIYEFGPYMMHRTIRGSEHSGTFGIVVNTVKEEFALVQNSIENGPEIVHTFDSVKSAQKLCPVFAVFTNRISEINLTLSNTFNFTKAFWNVVIG